MSKPFLLSLLIAAATICGCQKGPARNAVSAAAPGGYFAWEKLQSGEYKQVKKNYFMNKDLCRNVISVLNEQSTQQPRSNWVLSHTTDSSFECWPESLNPNECYSKNRKNSVHSGLPADVLTGAADGNRR